MTDLMVHRGPDDRGTYLAPGVALGVRRLSIVDVAHGHQPVSSEDGKVWAIQNGELYNHEAIRSDLEGRAHRFTSRCDTEVLPHLYQQVGIAVPEQLRGKFAIAVWDESRRRALLARDRLGVKPLYFAVVGDLLVFASELKSVLGSGLVEAELDYEAIDAYLTFGFFAGPTTPVRAVKKVLPGHRLVVADGNVVEEPYWTLPYPDGRSSLGDTELAEAVFEALDEAVRLRLMSDVPLGVMLSGGLDSSVVAALMARHTTGAVKTFSVGFVEDVEGNELADARLVASALGTDHHELELSFADEAVPLDELLWHLDEPLADLSSLGFYALSRLAAREVTVALSGQGADEIFGGYVSHRNAAIAAGIARLPSAAQWGIRRLSPGAPGRYRRGAAIATSRDSVGRFLLQYGRVSSEERRRVVRGRLADVSGRFDAQLVADRLDGHRDDDAFAEMLFLYQHFGLVDDMLHYFDRASMAHSLEVRVPFLDHHLVELLATVPAQFKVNRRLERKVLLRRLARGLVPDQVIEKRKIGFFSTAVEGWFRKQLHGEAADWLLTPGKADELLDTNEVRLLVNSYLRGEDVNARLLLALLMLKVWLADTLPRAMSSRALART
jgi:asparagine synthase (glutamine-hydrolysing)